MEKIIVVKSAKVGGADDRKWAELIDQEDKLHRVFPSIKLPDGEWRDLSDKVLPLIEQCETQEIVGKGIKLTKEKVGQYYNVVDFIYISEQIQVDKSKITEQQVAPTAPKPDPKNRAFALSYAKDIACARIQAGKESTPKDVLSMAEMFTLYLDNGLPLEALKVYAEIQKELKKED